MRQPDWQSDDGAIQLYCGDCLTLLPELRADAVVTDPPYGIAYESGMTGHHGGKSLPGIAGDQNTSLRDRVVEWMNGTTGLIFGTWKQSKPQGCRAVLIWEKGDHVGMGDLSIPWKPNTEEVYVLGGGFSGHRGSSVLRINAPVSWNSVSFGRLHAHEKPVELMEALLKKVEGQTILDPFMGSGTTGVACIRTGRKFIGIELERKYFDIAVKRIKAELAQPRLFAPEPPKETQLELIGAAP